MCNFVHKKIIVIWCQRHHFYEILNKFDNHGEEKNKISWINYTFILHFISQFLNLINLAILSLIHAWNLSFTHSRLKGISRMRGSPRETYILNLKNRLLWILVWCGKCKLVHLQIDVMSIIFSIWLINDLTTYSSST